LNTPTLVAAAQFAAVGELVVGAYHSAGVLAGDDRYRSVLADTAGRAAQASVYVVHDDAGQLVATVTLTTPGSPYAQVAGPGELEFRMLAVDPAAAGRGIGSALVDFCMEQAAARGDTAVVLCVVDTNAAAVRLYRRLGFEHLPDRDMLVAGGVRLLVMGRSTGR